MPSEQLPEEVFLACPTGRSPGGRTIDLFFSSSRTSTCWAECISKMAWECLGLLQEELEEAAVRRKAWSCCCSPDSDYWKEGWIQVNLQFVFCKTVNNQTDLWLARLYLHRLHFIKLENSQLWNLSALSCGWKGKEAVSQGTASVHKPFPQISVSLRLRL